MIGSFSRLSWRCRECPEVDTCDEKRMELCAVKIEPPQFEFPAMPKMTIKHTGIRIDSGTSIQMSQEDSDKITEYLRARIAEETERLWSQCLFGDGR